MFLANLGNALVGGATGKDVIQADISSVATEMQTEKQDNTLLYIAMLIGVLMFGGLFYLITKK